MKINKKVLGVIAQVARNEIRNNVNSTFPFCNGIFHQPKRPVKKK
jgi:cyclic lactone autoinducer peptide